MILNLDAVITLKNQLSEKFHIYLHFHDACGSQSFSFDAPVSQEVQNYISEYVKTLGGIVQFSKAGNHFIVN